MEEIFEIIRRISAQGAAVLVVEQNAAMALAVADTGFVLDLGEITLHGPTAELMASPVVKASYL